MRRLCLLGILAALTPGLKAEDEVTAVLSGNTLSIGLTNSNTYCAFQMDIALPDGVSLTAVNAMGNRLSQTGSDTEAGGTKFIVAHKNQNGNVWRIIAHNLGNAEIADTNGKLINIILDNAVSDTASVAFSNILFVNRSDMTQTAFAAKWEVERTIDIFDTQTVASADADGYVRLYRTIPANTWATLCLPFDLNVSPDWTVKKLAGSSIDGEGNISLHFDDAQSIVAGVPYMVMTPEDVTVIDGGSGLCSLQTVPTTQTTDHIDFIPSFTKSLLPAGCWYVAQGKNKLFKASKDVAMNAFRAYFSLKEGASEVRTITLDLDSETAMEDISLTPKHSPDVVYDLQGRCIESSAMQKGGVYIVNGVKRIIK